MTPKQINKDLANEQLAAMMRGAQDHTEEPSRVWTPMQFVTRGPEYECWENEFYYCSVRRYARGFPWKNSRYIVLGITATDETARHDWRDFQRIKNDIAGPEWEAVELYPAESRLVDPSNRFYLWCVPKGIFTFGMQHRSVIRHADAIAPQRPFPEEASK